MIRFTLLQVWEETVFMTNVLIDNPIINSPFTEPSRHFRFNDDGITDEIIPARRISDHLVPIPKPKNRGAVAGLFDDQQSTESLKPNEFINRLRNEVRAWRLSGYVRVTNTTRRLLEYWTDPKRERRLFFCRMKAWKLVITRVARCSWPINWAGTRSCSL